MCLTTTKKRTQQYYDKIKHKKEVKAYKVVLVKPADPHLKIEPRIISSVRFHEWEPGVNHGVISKILLSEPGRMMRTGLHNRKRLNDDTMIDINAGIHVYISKRDAEHMSILCGDKRLMTVYCDPDDLIGADINIWGCAVFTKVRLTTREYNRLIKEGENAYAVR